MKEATQTKYGFRAIFLFSFQKPIQQTDPDMPRPRRLATLAILIALAAAGLFLFTRHERPAPPEPLTAATTQKSPPSIVRLALRIPHSVLSAYLDQAIAQKILETSFSPKGMESETLSFTLSKTGPASIGTIGTELRIIIPLKARAALVASSLGNSFLSLLQPAEARLTATFATPLSITPEWNLQTNFRLVGLQLDSRPEISIGPVSIDLSDAIEALLQRHAPHLAQKLDSEAQKSMELRNAARTLWKGLQSPHALGTEPPILAGCSCRGLRGAIMPDKEGLTAFAEMTGILLASTDAAMLSAPEPLPPFAQLPADEQNNRTSSIALHLAIPFSDLNGELRARLVGSTIEAGHHKAAIKALEAYGSTKGLTLRIEIGGHLQGTFYLSGQPRYERATGSISLNSVELIGATGNPLLDGSTPVLASAIQEQLSRHLSIPLDAHARNAAAMLETTTQKNGKSTPFAITAEHISIQECRIIPDSKTLHLFIEAEAELALLAKGKGLGKQE